MFRKSISLLTAEQKRDLASKGIDAQLLSHWRTGRRLPTEPQAVIYADVAGLDRHQLADELALLRATDEQRPHLERILGKVAAGVLVMLACGLGGNAPPAPATGDRTATMYRTVARWTWLRWCRA